jgi:hypothetical protein
MKLNRILGALVLGFLQVAIVGALAIPNWAAPPYWSPPERVQSRGRGDSQDPRIGVESIQTILTSPLPFARGARWPCLRPVTFRYKPELDPTGLEQYGLVAEEVAEVYPDLVTCDKDGRPETVRYQLLAPMLLNEVQKQHATLEEQQQRIRRLEERLVALEEGSRNRARGNTGN